MIHLWSRTSGSSQVGFLGRLLCRIPLLPSVALQVSMRKRLHLLSGCVDGVHKVSMQGWSLKKSWCRYHSRCQHRLHCQACLVCLWVQTGANHQHWISTRLVQVARSLKCLMFRFHNQSNTLFPTVRMFVLIRKFGAPLPCKARMGIGMALEIQCLEAQQQVS